MTQTAFVDEYMAADESTANIPNDTFVAESQIENGSLSKIEFFDVDSFRARFSDEEILSSTVQAAKNEFGRYRSDVANAVKRARNLGGVLTLHKTLVPTGKWLATSEKTYGNSPGLRMRQKAMRLYENWDTILSRLSPENKLTFRHAEALIRDISTNPLEAASPCFTSNSVEWLTPRKILTPTLKVLGTIDVDVCSNEGEPNVPASLHLTKKDDGLSEEPWKGRVYMNPPYGTNIAAWVERLADEFEQGNVSEGITLLPSRTDTIYLGRLSEYARAFIRGRLRFSQSTKPAPFPSVVVYLGQDTQKFADAFCKLGDVFVPYSNEAEEKHGRMQTRKKKSA